MKRPNRNEFVGELVDNRGFTAFTDVCKYADALVVYADFLEQLAEDRAEIIELWNSWFDKMEEDGAFR